MGLEDVTVQLDERWAAVGGGFVARSNDGKKMLL